MIDAKAAKEQLSKNDLTISELARRMGRNRPEVSAWVNGRRRPRLDTAAHMAKILKCKVDDLIAR